MDNCNTKLMFIGFSLVVLFFMHLNMQRLSGIDSSCLVGHERTLSQLESFQDSLLESDLLVSFVDKSDLSRLERDKREAERRVEKLIRQLKIVQSELTKLKLKMMNFSKEKGSGAREGGEKSVGLGRESISKADNSRDKGKGLGRENIIERKTVSKGSIGVNIGREIKSISKKIVGETQEVNLQQQQQPIHDQHSSASTCQEMHKQFEVNRDFIYDAKNRMKELRDRMLKNCDRKRL